MEIDFNVEAGGYRLLSSGSLLNIVNQPILMTVEIDGNQAVSVALHFHAEKHQKGKGLVRSLSIDGTVDEWHLYGSEGGENRHLTEPVPILHYEEGAEVLTLYLQIHSQKVAEDGTVKVDFYWLEGSEDSPADIIG